MLHPAANRHSKGQINPLRRPSLPFASLYTIQKVPQGQINGFFSAFKPAVYHLSPSQRRPWQKTGSHRPFDGLFALSSRHWPHSLCKRGKRKHTLSPAQRRPSQKTCSSTPQSLHPATYLSIYPSVYLSIYLSVCLSVCLSICLSINLSIYLAI